MTDTDLQSVAERLAPLLEWEGDGARYRIVRPHETVFVWWDVQTFDGGKWQHDSQRVDSEAKAIITALLEAAGDAEGMQVERDEEGFYVARYNTQDRAWDILRHDGTWERRTEETDTTFPDRLSAAIAMGDAIMAERKAARVTASMDAEDRRFAQAEDNEPAEATQREKRKPLAVGDEVSFPTGNDVLIGQDHGYARGAPAGIVFTVTRAIKQGVFLTADGYGGKPGTDAYGCGSLFLPKSQFYKAERQAKAEPKGHAVEWEQFAMPFDPSAEPAETFPQYIVRAARKDIDGPGCLMGIAYLRLDSADSYVAINVDGTDGGPARWLQSDIDARANGEFVRVTESEAKRRVRRERIVYNKGNGLYYRFHTADPDEGSDTWKNDGKGWQPGQRPQIDTIDWPEVPDPSKPAPDANGLTNAQARALVLDLERRVKMLEAGR